MLVLLCGHPLSGSYRKGEEVEARGGDRMELADVMSQGKVGFVVDSICGGIVRRYEGLVMV